MHGSLIISLLLGLGWLLAIGMGVALWALIYHIGSRYAFTPAGISRMGPRLGERLASTSFTYNGESLTLQRFLSPSHPTLLVFLKKAHQVDQQLIDDLLRLASFSRGELQVVVFVAESLGRYQRLLEANRALQIVRLPDQVLLSKLGVRVVPYALLVDQQAKLRGKGLVNYLPHLCYTIASAQPSWDRDELVATLQHCRPYLPTPQHIKDIPELARHGNGSPLLPR